MADVPAQLPVMARRHGSAARPKPSRPRVAPGAGLVIWGGNASLPAADNAGNAVGLDASVPLLVGEPWGSTLQAPMAMARQRHWGLPPPGGPTERRARDVGRRTAGPHANRVRGQASLTTKRPHRSSGRRKLLCSLAEPGVVAHLKPLRLDLVFGASMSLQYDPDQHVDADKWLKFDESERIEAVREYHRRAKVRLPNDRLHAATHVIVENSGKHIQCRRSSSG